MDIGWAVKAVKNGEKVRRAEWGVLADAYREAGGRSWDHLYLEEREGHDPAVMVRHGDGSASHFVMIDAHLLAEDWEPVRLMDFSDALRAMKQGRKVRRAVWPVPSSVQAYASLEIASPGDCDPCFVCTYNDGTRAVMYVSAYHMLECDDWELM